ncbi:MAG: hypothetical protein HY064_16025 [Bacteroidetes bacterium]|nr:hypothetical protein [Bacteroidota bacterium]
MKTVTVIIDFDNYFGTDISVQTSEKLEYAFSEFINLCEVQYKDVANIQLRLYGGWHQGNTLTKQASVLQQLLANVNIFPKVQGKKIIQGSVEMVSEILGIPDYNWGYTYKESDGMKAMRVNPECDDSICNANKSICPKYVLSNFTKNKEKKCPIGNCVNIHKTVFKGVEQKMVDTIIACDILSVIEDNNFRGLIVISDDQDLFPSIALANEKRKYYPNRRNDEIILGIQNDQIFDFITEFLSPFKIQTILV